MSSETIQLGNFGLKMVDDEEIDVNDLEVAMINESFEEKLKQSQFFHSSQSTDLKSLFYGDGILNETTGKRDSTEFTEEEVKIKLTPLKFLPRITPNSELEDDAERGRQLDIELDRMMLEEEDKYFFSNSPPSLLSPEDDKPEQISRYKFSSASTFVLDQNSSSFYSSFESQTDHDSIDCADAAEAVAYDVIQSLFADDENSGEPVASDDEDEDMVLSASILQVLQDDETDSFEDDDSKEGMPSVKKQKLADDEDSTNEELPPPPPRNDSLQTIPSPMATEDEQQVPVVESWEELFKEPSAAEKMHNEARAILKKIRAERKASQL